MKLGAIVIAVYAMDASTIDLTLSLVQDVFGRAAPANWRCTHKKTPEDFLISGFFNAVIEALW